MEMSFEEIVKALEGKVIVDNHYKNFNKFCIDNRKIEKDNIAVLFHRIRPVFESKSVVV